MLAVQLGLASKCGHVRARVGFRQREGRDGFAARHARQVMLAQFVRAHQRNGAAAQALHGEGKVRQPFVAGEGFAQDADGAGIDFRQRAAPGAARAARDRIAQPAGLAHGLDQFLAGRVGVVMVHVAQRGFAPGVDVMRQLAVRIVKERPVQPACVTHHQFPSKTGFCLATKAS
ncbi:hypothetical protein D3C86_1603320 [compost metagenome]